MITDAFDDKSPAKINVKQLSLAGIGLLKIRTSILSVPI